MNLKGFFRRLILLLLRKANNNLRVKYFRSQGMKIGKGTLINTLSFSTEPYLIEIGDHVAIAYGTQIITHDGAIWSFRNEIENADVFGKIKIGNNVFIGNNCIILPNTTIGDNCVVGAGSVLRGRFPDNSVIFGNPAKVVLNTSMQKFLYLQNPGLMKTAHLSDAKKNKIIKQHFGIKQGN
jgi:acetyltransferase-like isoleucine patch superfamily enzyme